MGRELRFILEMFHDVASAFQPTNMVKKKIPDTYHNTPFALTAEQQKCL
jgi:hypothetical protein